MPLCKFVPLYKNTHKHHCTSIFVRTFIDTLQSLAPYPSQLSANPEPLP